MLWKQYIKHHTYTTIHPKRLIGIVFLLFHEIKLKEIMKYVPSLLYVAYVQLMEHTYL